MGTIVRLESGIYRASAFFDDTSVWVFGFSHSDALGNLMAKIANLGLVLNTKSHATKN